MIHSKWLFTLAAAVTLPLTTGCFLDLSTEEFNDNITNPLSQWELNKVLQCQDAIKDAGQQFVNKKLNRFEHCADAAISVQVYWEQGLLNENAYKYWSNWARNKCENAARQVKWASTNMVNKIVYKCGPVAHLAFDPAVDDRGDPLGFKSILEEIGPASLAAEMTAMGGMGGMTQAFTEAMGNAEGNTELATVVAGAQCLWKELLVDLMISLELPRVNEAARILEGGEGPDDQFFFFLGVTQDTLDERCLILDAVS